MGQERMSLKEESERGSSKGGEGTLGFIVKTKKESPEAKERTGFTPLGGGGESRDVDAK